MPPLEPSFLLEHADFVRALARSLIRDSATAEDIEQETWARVLTKGPRNRSNVRGWLATVVRNVVRNRARSQARRDSHEVAAARPEAVAPSSMAAEQSDTLRSVVGAVIELDEPYRSTVLALYFQGLSSDELARREGVPHATVRSRHARALAKLRERLDREYGDRAAWCAGLAGLTGLEAAAPIGAIGIVVAAAALVALLGGAAWWNAASAARTPQQLELASATPRAEPAAPSIAAPAEGETPPTAARGSASTPSTSGSSRTTTA